MTDRAEGDRRLTLAAYRPRPGARRGGGGWRRLGAAAAALVVACQASPQEICRALVDRNAACEYQVAEDAADRCVAVTAAATAACRASTLALADCVADAACDTEADVCDACERRWRADCQNANAFGADW